jgi:hypothetical protein
MGELPIVMESNGSPPAQTGTSQIWGPPAVDHARGDETFPRRLEWIAVILFVVNFFMMIYTSSMYYRDEAWGLTMVAVSTATAVVLLLSVALSVFGMTALSKFSLGVGLVGLMISVISFGAKLMQQISEYSGYF